MILDDQALRHLRERLEVALEQGLDEVARLVLCVALGDVHHEGLDHQRPRPAVDDLRVDGEDGGIVLEDDMQINSQSRGRCLTTNTTGMQITPTSAFHYTISNTVHVTVATLGGIAQESKRMDHDKGSDRSSCNAFAM